MSTLRFAKIDEELVQLRTESVKLATEVSSIKSWISEVAEGVKRLLERQTEVERAQDRSRPTDWLRIVGAIVSTVAVVGSIFTLAEWRVQVNNVPYNDKIGRLERVLELQTALIERIDDRRARDSRSLAVLEERVSRIDRAFAWAPTIRLAQP